jgi:RNA polymerase sigma factor (sigma-70 family)
VTATQRRTPGAPPGLEGRGDAELLADTERPADAFAVFYRRHVAALLRFAASRGMDADTAADVVADTFFAALKGRAGYRAEHDTARLWLLTIAVRRLADVHRRRATEQRRAERLQTEAIVLSATDRDGYERLLAGADGLGLDALADLPEAQQQAIRARVVEDRGYAEIAATLGLSEPATRQHVSRGLAALRRTLGRQR